MFQFATLSSLVGRRSQARWSHPTWIILAVLLLLLSGCARKPEISTVYGQRNSAAGAQSVNGTAVLAELFEKGGHKVYGWKKLSPRLNSVQTIVWAPDDFAPPTAAQREFLEDWLATMPGRTLVYIGRDYDAAPEYWQRVRPGASAEQAPEIARRLAAARAEYDSARARMAKESYARWFTVHGDPPKRAVTTLAGEWAAGVDPARIEITLQGRLDAPLDSQRGGSDWQSAPIREVLLESEGDALVSRITDSRWYNSKVIVVTNGSFLLNLPLVNPEHRKLAAQLVAECGPPGTVLFLESGPGGPPISKSDSKKALTGFEWLTVWPINAIVLHLLALGIVYIMSNFPIFGRPREIKFSTLLRANGLWVVPFATIPGSEEEVASSDFGKHLRSLGDLLERTNDEGYAHARLQYYHEHVKRDSGAAHGDKQKKK